ncbi:MAG: glycosyltransferase family 2 protein [Candidatus Parcubacteria bacterium]|nr:glycosyltransferase family 2 protein [Candidatus Parcubacteria bacterium]
MSISIVIPNYNGEEILAKNLPKVFEAVDNAEVIVVDDASTDGSLRTLNNFRSKISIIKNERNLGFSSSVNKGVREAKGEIVILLNTDVVPEKNFLKPLLRHFEDGKIFAVGCMDKSIEDGKVILRGRGVGQWKRGFLVHSRGEINKASTLWVNGGSGAFRKSVWKKLGGFDELFNPFYWEDIDLSYRALKSGYKILFEPNSVVVHEHEKGAIKSTYSNFEVKTIAYRNQFIFVWKNLTDLDLCMLHLIWLPYHFAKAVTVWDLEFFKGFLMAFFLWPKIISSRFKSQKLFARKDYEITNASCE